MSRRLLSTLLLSFVVCTVSDEAGAWGRGHKIIRSWAVARLPQWQRQWIGEDHWRQLCSDYLSLQDRHAGGKSPELDKYCVMPGARVSLHDVNPPAASVSAMAWYLTQIAGRLEAGCTDEAMKFLGVFCHWNEDPGSPSAHSSPVSETVLRQLIPPPRDKVRFNYIYGYGGIGDRGTYELPDEEYRPRLLGAGIPEAAARIYQEQRVLERNASAHIIPVIQDEMYGDGLRADEQRASAALANAKHVCNVLYTVLCLAKGRIAPEKSKPLESQRLTRWLSDFQGGRTARPYYVVPFLVDQALDAKRQLHPLAFPGEGAETRVAFGFGMGAPVALDYTIAPGGVFAEFTCRVGLHPTAGPQGNVTFAVAVNGKVVHTTEAIAAGAPPVGIRVRLPSTPVVKLSLRTIPAEGTPGEHNLTVWAEPTLHRAARPAGGS